MLQEWAAALLTLRVLSNEPMEEEPILIFFTTLKADSGWNEDMNGA